MAESVDLREGLASLVKDGNSVALEGFTHVIPFTAGHELLRLGRRELELIQMTPDVLYDQMVGLGAARKLVFSYAGALDDLAGRQHGEAGGDRRRQPRGAGPVRRPQPPPDRDGVG